MREFSVQPLTANGGQPTACGERRSDRSLRWGGAEVVRTFLGRFSIAAVCGAIAAAALFVRVNA